MKNAMLRSQTFIMSHRQTVLGLNFFSSILINLYFKDNFETFIKGQDKYCNFSKNKKKFPTKVRVLELFFNV